VSVAERARDLGWYHTIELAPGEVTQGVFDLRPYVHRYGLPERMDGVRALDVGTFDGFWAFEMERRGAEVVAIDLDWDRDFDWPAIRRPEEFSDTPREVTFRLAKEALGSKVERHNMSVYEATPENLGTFDLVFCGSVLIHLRDQVLAMERIANLCLERFISVEAYNRLLELLPFGVARYRALRDSSVVFWEPNVRAWKAMMATAGFGTVEEKGRLTLQARAGWRVRHVVLHAWKPEARPAGFEPATSASGGQRSIH
jgi:tRNA (mo5U34)-methyltransferase